VTASLPSFKEKPLIQTLSESFWHFEELVLAEQLKMMILWLRKAGAYLAD